MELRDAPEPEPGPGEALVRVEAVGICGSDMHAYLGHDERRPAPLILGHEPCGVALTGRLEGRRVAINPLASCGACDACVAGRDNICAGRQIISLPPREGAFAERVAVPERNLVEVPDGVPPERAALTEPLACGWHAVALAARALDRPVAACRVAVVGGGAIGLGAALVAAAQGARDIAIAETNPARHPTLAAAGPFRPYDPAADAPAPASADLVIDAVGSDDSRAAASALARPGGVIAHIGLAGGDGGLDMRRFTLQEIAVIGSYTYTMAEFRDTARAIFAGRLGDFGWLEERPLAEGAAAFADLLAGRVAAAKIVLRP